ncbi:hypothetical protein B0T24DRAFT_46073 [Lasiosphaeria ovina]|uniref:Autophagy-related protein 1 n=1 Tax=Lasiosphaeria ovina TaxID=92902 RepID=A0AAE0NKZ7_9PEZI|nr:hypothetical protein B0T24DRAFT_46073 [Lasiosphaeria ovina]
MDSYDDSQPTQATQNVLDPRRLGEQNSGFSDEEISDIICLLVPYSPAARREVKKNAIGNSPHIVGRNDAAQIDVNYELEDDASNFSLAPQDVGEYHIALRFSSQVKSPLQGFTFGRNPGRCDICLTDDPLRRLSNIHFRIYFNEFSVLMLEDQSTNGTIVDDNLLKAKTAISHEAKRTLVSGSKIKVLMHDSSNDLVFLVRVPLLEGKVREDYKRNLQNYMNRRASLVRDVNATIVPGPGGHVDIFRPLPQRAAATPWAGGANHQVNIKATPGPGHLDGLQKAWAGSDKYNRVGEIGKGAFATVYKVTSKFNGNPYAAKELDKRNFMKNGVLDQKVENEMKIMQKVEHPHIVKYVEHLDWDDRLFIIIMEFIAGGDLGKLISDNGPLSEIETQSMAKQLLDSLDYLHKMNITHRDVKPDNILVSSRYPLVVKLTDFGLSKMIDNEETFLRTFCGTLLYCAPEVYSEFADYDEYGHRQPRNRHHRPPVRQRYDQAVDIWSLGGVLFYVLTKKPPFPAKNGAGHSELLHQIMTKPLDVSPLIQANVSTDGIDFLSRMLDRRPETRATVEFLQAHRWVGGSGAGPQLNASQSYDEISDEELHIEASQLSLAERQDDGHSVGLAPGSDDEIVDDDETVNDENQFSGYESEKENYTFGPGNQPQRLFGEVNVSALGSSGVIPVDRLNLPLSMTSFASTEILGSQLEIRDSFESEDSLTPRQKSQTSQPHLGNPRASISLGESRSVNALNNMTFDVASQSLGGTESILEHLNMKSRGGSLLRSHTSDLNTSKRKPSFDATDEAEASALRDRRVLKRLRSEGSVDVVPSNTADESDYELLALVPPVARAQSGRQIDSPVHKSTYWLAADKSTWHLMYPEMTQLQLDAFKAAAVSRGEEFGPGKSPLWDLAVKYFPATHCEGVTSGGRASGDGGTVPSTASGVLASQDIPDTQDQGTCFVMPLQPDTQGKPAVACLQSSSASAVADISILITESMVSWGRASDNVQPYPLKNEAKVPKYAFKILLWRPDYEPSKNIRPWNHNRDTSEEPFHFYISTKATKGIYVNGVHLPSDNCKYAAGPCTYWFRLHDQDRVVVWQTIDASYRTELTFRCDWGASADRRPSQGDSSRPTLVPQATAKKLDEMCIRAEKKIRNRTEHDLKLDEANHDVDERELNIERERERSSIFERKRQEACRALVSKTRRNSPAGGPSDQSTTQSAWTSYLTGGRTVATFRHASPSTIDLLRGARRG